MTPSAIDTTDNTALALDSKQPNSVQAMTWIVCRGADRPVRAGRVACPTSSSPADVAVEKCLQCRHLSATPIDRLPDAMCSTDSGQESEVRWGVL